MEDQIRRDPIVGARRTSNYFWSCFLLIGGLGFLLAGTSSYFGMNLLPFSNTKDLVFIPQGIVMIFYGTLSIGISIYIFITIFLNIGSGYNEYNKIDSIIKIVRKGFPGQNRQILLTYPLTTIKSIGIKVTEGLNPNRAIYLCLKDKRTIPVNSIQGPISITELEDKATELAKFLDLKLENL